MWSSFLAVFRKEVIHLRRDPGTLRLVLFIPALQLVLFGFLDQTVRDLPTVVVDQERSTESRLLIDRLNATGTFHVDEITSSTEHARDRIRQGAARVAVVLPPDFGDRRAHGEQAQVLVLIDGSDSTASGQALAAVNGLAVADAPGPPPSLDVRPVILFNPEGRTANYIIPGLVAVILQIIGIVLTAGAIVRERERGTYEQLLVTPISPLGLVLGKLTPYLALGYVEMTLVLLLMRYLFAVEIHGNVLVIYVAAFPYLLALLSLGLVVSARATTQMEAQQMAQLVFLPSIFLSGYIFPFAGMPWILQAIGALFPVTHMIRVMRGVVLREATLWDLLPEIGALCAISLVLTLVGARSVRKVVD